MLTDSGDDNDYRNECENLQGYSKPTRSRMLGR